MRGELEWEFLHLCPTTETPETFTWVFNTRFLPLLVSTEKRKFVFKDDNRLKEDGSTFLCSRVG